jgi:hypothetical protein
VHSRTVAAKAGAASQDVLRADEAMALLPCAFPHRHKHCYRSIRLVQPQSEIRCSDMFRRKAAEFQHSRDGAIMVISGAMPCNSDLIQK